MKVTIVHFTKEPIELDIQSSDRSIDIINKLLDIDKKNTIPIFRHLLFFNNQEIPHDKSMEDYNITENSTIVWKLQIGNRLCPHCIKL
jgi:hypothetical protein